MFQYSEHQGCWSKQNTRLIWPLRNSFKFKPVDESSRRKSQPLRRYWGSKDAPKATIPLGPGNPFWRMMFNCGISEAWCKYMWYDSPKSHEYKLLKHAAVCSLTPDLMAFVASCIILFHPQKLKPTGTSCLLCRPSTLTPHATWQKKGQVSTQIWRQEKHMPSNWPKSSLYCPFWLQNKTATVLSIPRLSTKSHTTNHHTSRSLTSKSSSSLAAKQWWSLSDGHHKFLSERRPPRKIGTV